MAKFVQSEMKVIKPDEAITLISPESLEKYWDKYCNVPKDDCDCIKEPFIMFPKGTNDFEICEWFNKMYPDGLLALMKKRMTKIFGDEYVKNWDNFKKQPYLVENAACLTEEDKKRFLFEFAEE